MSQLFTDPAPTPVASYGEPEPTSPRLGIFLGRVLDACLHLAMFLVPLYFCSSTLDVLELNKQLLLIVLASVGMMAWFGKGLAEKRFSLARSWLHLVVLIFGFGYLVTTLMSHDRHLSMVGQLGQGSWAFATIGSLVALYFVAVNRVRSLTQVYDLVFTFLLSSVFVALYGLFQMLGWYWSPSDVTHLKTFNSIGSVFSLSLFLTVPLVISASLAVHGCRDKVCLLGTEGAQGIFARSVVWASMLTSLAVLFCVDYWAAWVSLLFGTLVTVGIGFIRTRYVNRSGKLIVPLVLVGISALLLVFKTPLQLSLPAEVAPSQTMTWLIAKGALQSAPVFGTGPGTWIYDYAMYRVPEINLSPFWNVRFDRGTTAFLSMLATIGIFGTLIWLLLVVSGVVKSAAHLKTERNDDTWHAYLMVFSGWATISFIAFVYNYNVAHQFLFWMFLALLGSLVTRQVMVWDARRGVGAFGVVSVAFIVAFVGGISSCWLAGQRFFAELAYSKAVMMYRGGSGAEAVVPLLQKAMTLDSGNDIYVRNLSQAELVKVATMVKANPSQAEFSALQEQVAKTVRIALQARDLNPQNVDNWANLALVYQTVASFTAGADEHAIKNYEEASAREPQNPVFMNEIGKLYILRADAYRVQLEQKDVAKQAEARTAIPENLRLAESWLKRSIAAKPDYFPAHYHLGIVREREGKLQDAIVELSNALAADRQNVGIAFELAILHYRNRNLDAAEKLLAAIVQAQPSQVNARWYLAALLDERGKRDQAIAQLAALQQMDPSNAAVAQKLTQLRDQASGKPTPPKAPALPEPLKEEVSGPSTNNPLKK
jgi:tetratricopeptide (TPR) repeat protein